MPDGVRQLVGAGLAAGIGVIAAGTAGAAAAFNADVNNRQLHPGDRELARDLARKSAGKYSVQQIEEQMRLMGNRAYNAEPNTAEVLTDMNAIVDSLNKDPGMPKTSDGRAVVEVPGQPNAQIQQFIMSNTTDNAGYIPGVSPYVGSKTEGQSLPYGSNTPATTAARCANGDLACISGVGAQQSSIPELSDAARNTIASGAEATSRAAGVVAAGATAVAARGGPYGRPAQAAAVGATAIGTAADAIGQIVRPNVGEALQDAMLTTFQEWADRKMPGIAPATNEVVEAWKASGSSKSLDSWVNEQWKAFLERTAK
ncbi:MAG: hypothetical protein ACO1OR_07685 [Hydrogenophaga sp.]|uniref:hypothetical protein n=1 Tax=Hydrogenophaga intermedia TaxID=65786 RepID=UPI002044C3C8|nr:hypothetical protein [Hydrogenophaga intermedia]